METSNYGGSFESLSTIQPEIRRLDPFWATRLWQKLIKEALMTVKVGRQRHFLKNYDDVFSGEDLVNNVLVFLKGCTSELDVQKIDRSNALKVCQKMMDKKMFESVVPKGNHKFETSSSRLYRFPQEQVIEDVADDHDQQKPIFKSLCVEEEKENSAASFNSSLFSPESKFSAKRRSMRLKTPLLKVRDTKPSPVRLSRRCSRDFDQEATLYQRETALSLLLQLLDVPILESLLSVPADLPPLPEAPAPFVLENDFTPRRAAASRPPAAPVAGVPWVRAASLCLDGRHPAGIAGLWSVQAVKALCYQAVAERFSYCAMESVVPGEYFAVCVPIVRMLKEGGMRRKALLALQLLVCHMPARRRCQLQHLLRFLHLVVNDLFVSVDKKVTNYEAVIRDFLSVVFRHPLVSMEPQKILFDFLLLKHEAIFETPSALHDVKESGVRFCRSVSLENLSEATANFTDRCLLDLASSIVDSTDIKLAEKKLWLKKLKKHHVATYDACNLKE